MMTRSDLRVLARWLKSGATLEEVEATSSIGLVGNERFSESCRRAYTLLWTWCTYRHGGEAGRKQDRAYEKLGSSGFDRRMQRARRIRQHIMEKFA